MKDGFRNDTSGIKKAVRAAEVMGADEPRRGDEGEGIEEVREIGRECGGDAGAEGVAYQAESVGGASCPGDGGGDQHEEDLGREESDVVV